MWETLFHFDIGRTSAQVAQRGGIFIFRDIQKLFECGPGQSALDGSP